MTSVKCLCPWSNHAMVERALIWGPDRPEFEFLILHCKLCSVANVILLTGLIIVMTALGGHEDPRE